MAYNVKPGCVSDAASDREDEEEGCPDCGRPPLECRCALLDADLDEPIGEDWGNPDA